MTEQRRTVSTGEREKLAGESKAMPDGSYPIANVGDLKNAIQAIGRAKNPSAVKAHIKRRAKALGRTDLIPEDWRSAEENAEFRAFQPDEPDADDMGGPDDGDHDQCETCDGTGETDMGECPDCGGTGVPQIEGLVGGQSFNSTDPADLERRELVADLDGMFEHRSVPLFEMRDTSDGHVRFSGYASETETPYEVAGFTETIARGAFKRTLGEQPDVRLNINHGEGGQLPIARTKNGTLSLSEDARGLKVDADLDPQRAIVQEVRRAVERGDVDEMSFAFRATEQEWSEDRTKRLIRSVALHKGDVSVVTAGANSNTSATVRGLVGGLELRSGKTISKATREKLERIKQEADELLAKPEEEQAETEQAAREGELKISVMRGQLEVAKARRRRIA